MDVLSALRYEGYSYSSQAVSELNATGAPTRQAFVTGLSIPYGLLLIACSVGIWVSAGERRGGRFTAGMLAVSAVVGVVTPLFFPMDQREAMAAGEGTLRGSLHVPATAVGSLFIFLTMGFGSTLHGKRFRIYTFGTILTLLVFGLWAGLDAPRIEAAEPTPWHGTKERINIYTYLLWVVVLAISIWRVHAGADSDKGSGREGASRASLHCGRLLDRRSANSGGGDSCPGAVYRIFAALGRLEVVPGELVEGPLGIWTRGTPGFSLTSVHPSPSRFVPSRPAWSRFVPDLRRQFLTACASDLREVGRQLGRQELTRYSQFARFCI